MLAAMRDTRLRRGEEADAAALNAIYDPYVRDTAITFDIEPWTLEARRRWLGEFSDAGRHQLFVAERTGALVGYACSRRFREKAAYDTTVETSVYLAPEAHGQGVGRALYERLFAALQAVDAHRLVAGLTLPNPASVALHERFGFTAVGVLREVGRKFGRYWDVLWMERALRGG
jgi:phosphinothricin acetyltransferase